MNFPVIFKLNGITNLSEIPDDIKTRYQWRIVNRGQLDEDTNVFLRNYPFDISEGVTRLLSGRAARKQKAFPGKPNTQNTRNNKNNNNNQSGRRGGFNPARGGRPQTSATPRGTRLLDRREMKSTFRLLGTVNKRPFPMSAPPNKRFRTDLNSSFPSANRGPRPMRHHDMEQYNYNNQQPGLYNNGNNYWPSRHPNERQQQRQEFFERSNFELHSIASDNNGHFNDRSSYPMSRPDNSFNRNPNPPAHFNEGRNGYNNQPSNYDRNFMHAGPQV